MSQRHLLGCAIGLEPGRAGPVKAGGAAGRGSLDGSGRMYHAIGEAGQRRVLIDEFIEEISVLPDYLDVKVHGAPALHIRYQEVGMKESGFARVGGPDYAKPEWRIQPLDLGR